MEIAIILVVVVVVGVAGYWFVTRSKSTPPLPMSQRSPVVAAAPPGDVKSTITNAATKATQATALTNGVLADASRSRVALTLIPGG